MSATARTADLILSILQEDNCINTASGIVTLFGRLLSTQVTRDPLVTCVLNSHPKRVTVPDAVLIQLSS